MIFQAHVLTGKEGGDGPRYVYPLSLNERRDTAGSPHTAAAGGGAWWEVLVCYAVGCMLRVSEGDQRLACE